MPCASLPRAASSSKKPRFSAYPLPQPLLFYRTLLSHRDLGFSRKPNSHVFPFSFFLLLFKELPMHILRFGHIRRFCARRERGSPLPRSHLKINSPPVDVPPVSLPPVSPSCFLHSSGACCCTSLQSLRTVQYCLLRTWPYKGSGGLRFSGHTGTVRLIVGEL